ncbi:MAG TPA: Fur family transcriptional regulator [Patescibacteria group bacterium]|nr:Fur family transcriptional regulator [Patescibacteria group bacterium]
MDTLRTLLQSVDLKATPARLAVLSFLEDTHSPSDAEAIFVHLKEEHDVADRATIYRMLETFVDKGLIKRLEFGEGKYRYEVAGDDHHHLICEDCGKIEDISDCNISDLEKDIQKKKGFSVKQHSLEFFGLCKDCQQRAN